MRGVLRRGRRVSCPSVVLHARSRDDAESARVAVVASRRVGTAVRRNRAKRVLRAAAARTPLPRGVDVVLVARASTPAASSAVVEGELRSAIEQMFDSAGSSA